jgi:pyruvate,water dikinase
MSETKFFEAPGLGIWELDNSHFSRPMSLFSEELFTNSLVQGLKEGTDRYGLALSHLSYAMVNGFFYKKAVLCGISDDHCGALPDDLFSRSEIITRLERGTKALESKLWREDLKRWDIEVKPDSIARNKKLQAISPKSLSDQSLIQHLTDCRKNALEMMYRHHVFTIPAILPIGLYISMVREWTGLDSSESLYLLKGSTPVSKGAADNELDSLIDCLKRENFAPEDFVGKSSMEILEAIRSRADSATNHALNEYLNFVGFRLITGYDITDKFGFDMLDVVISNIWNKFDLLNIDDNDELLNEKIVYVRDQVPDKYKSEFNSLLNEARMVNRLRDERGVYNDVLGTGLARRVVLEVGLRLEKQGCISDPELILHASYKEMLLLLEKKSGSLDSDLINRARWFNANTVDDAPLILGGESAAPKPPLAMFPEISRPGMIALFTAINEIYDEHESISKENEIISGVPVSSGSYEGTARIICSLEDFSNITQGDILVTKNTTAAFNIILPLLGAIVTDRGGQLSHAAIVSREYGIPAVVSTGNATKIIKDGMKIKVDGSAGTVKILS